MMARTFKKRGDALGKTWNISKFGLVDEIWCFFCENLNFGESKGNWIFGLKLEMNVKKPLKNSKFGLVAKKIGIFARNMTHSEKW